MFRQSADPQISSFRGHLTILGTSTLSFEYPPQTLSMHAYNNEKAQKTIRDFKAATIRLFPAVLAAVGGNLNRSLKTPAVHSASPAAGVAKPRSRMVRMAHATFQWNIDHAAYRI